MEKVTESKAPYSWIGCPLKDRHVSNEMEYHSGAAEAYSLHLKTIISSHNLSALRRTSKNLEELQNVSFKDEKTRSRLIARQKERIADLEAEIAAENPDMPATSSMVLPLLGLVPSQCTYEMRDETSGTICFYREGIRIVNVDLQELPNTLEEFTKNVMDVMLTEGMDSIVGEGVSDNDVLFLDPSSGISYAVTMRTKSADGGLIADVNRICVDVHSAEEDAGIGVMVKSNPVWATTLRENAILDGIREDPELDAIGVSAPSVYKVNGRKMCMAVASGCVPVEKLPESEIRRLTPRIVKATQILERNTPKYLSELVIDEQNVYGDLLSENREGIEKALASMKKKAQSEDISEERRDGARARAEVVKGIYRLIKENLAHAKPAMPANEYFDEQCWQKELPVLARIADLGDAHAESVGYLSKRGMFTTDISDSRFSNWLYHRDSNILYKIDENATTKGSRYSCLARICDTGEAVPELERDMIAQGMLDDNDTLNDAFLSLYVMNLRTAYFNKKKVDSNPEPENPFHGMMRSRLRRARGYLERIGDERLADEFETEVREHFGKEVYKEVYNKMPSMGEVAR